MAGALLLCVSWSSGEEPPALRIGVRIRAYVTESSANESHSKRLTGTLIGVDEKILSLETSRNKAPLLVARENVTRLDLSIRRGQRGKGALIGLGVGLATGVLLGLASGDDEDFCCLTAGDKAVIFGVLLAPVGTVVGVAAAPGEQWQVIPPDRVRLGHDTTSRSGRGVSIAFRF